MTTSLPAWAQQLLVNLELSPIEVDTAALHQLVNAVNAHPTAKDALVMGFIAGYAAGMAQGEGMASFDRAHTASLRFMHRTLTGE